MGVGGRCYRQHQAIGLRLLEGTRASAALWARVHGRPSPPPSPSTHGSFRLGLWHPRSSSGALRCLQQGGMQRGSPCQMPQQKHSLAACTSGFVRGCCIKWTISAERRWPFLLQRWQAMLRPCWCGKPCAPTSNHVNFCFGGCQCRVVNVECKLTQVGMLQAAQQQLCWKKQAGPTAGCWKPDPQPSRRPSSHKTPQKRIYCGVGAIQGCLGPGSDKRRLGRACRAAAWGGSCPAGPTSVSG